MKRLRIQVIRITPVRDDAGNLLHHAFEVMKEFAPEEEGASEEALAVYRQANADPAIRYELQRGSLRPARRKRSLRRP